MQTPKSNRAILASGSAYFDFRPMMQTGMVSSAFSNSAHASYCRISRSLNIASNHQLARKRSRERRSLATSSTGHVINKDIDVADFLFQDGVPNRTAGDMCLRRNAADSFDNLSVSVTLGVPPLMCCFASRFSLHSLSLTLIVGERHVARWCFHASGTNGSK